MERRVQHTKYLELPFDVVCDRLAMAGQSVLVRATDNASSHADHLVIHLDQDLPFFHIDETVTITASELVRHNDQLATIDLRWHADRRKRLLPNLEAKLLVHALIQSGPHATTAVSIDGAFDPPSTIFRRFEEALFTRRLIDAVAHTFLDTVAAIIRADLTQQAPK